MEEGIEDIKEYEEEFFRTSKLFREGAMRCVRPLCLCGASARARAICKCWQCSLSPLSLLSRNPCPTRSIPHSLLV